MKVRNDFVSNSSSSSFIVSSKLDRVQFLEALYPTKIECNGRNQDECCKNDQFLRDYTTLMLHTLHIWDNNSNIGLSSRNMRGGHCIYNNQLFRLFNKDGTLKPLNFEKITRNISFNPCGESKIGDLHCSTITEKSVLFSEWIYKEAWARNKIFYSDSRLKCECKTEFPETVKKVKDALSKGLHLYYCFCSYEGDAQIGGYFYVDCDEKHPTIESVFKPAIEEIVHWDRY